LDSQELACREYARKHNLEVARVFIEQGESAKFADRTQLLQLLEFCKVKGNAIAVLVVWKLDRFARNVEDHFAIKAALRRHGVSVVSVTEPITDDANGKLLETILAGFAAFDNDIRAMRTIQGLQQKIREGLFPWKAPLGYLPTKTGKKTIPDRPDPRRFEPLKTAWQLFASGAYAKADIVRLLENAGVLAYRGKAVSAQAIDHIFSNPYYAGVLRDPWTGAEYQGRHVPMVSRQDFAKVQQIIAMRNNSQPHHRATEEFPLRGLVRCPACQHPLTGSFSRGRSKSYPYYSCFAKDCPKRRQSHSAQTVHDEFLMFLRQLSVPRSTCLATLDEIRDAVAAEHEAAKNASRGLAEQCRNLDRQMQELIAMRASTLITDSEFVRQRDRIQRERHNLDAKTNLTPDRWLTNADQDTLVASLQDVCGLWGATPTAKKRWFEELLLPTGYLLNEVRTASRGLLFSTLAASGDGESDWVHKKRPSTNQLMADIRELISIIRWAEKDDEAPQKAA
jgi:site-specific DNA recombinase